MHHHVLPRFYAETLERGDITTALGAVLTHGSLEAHLEVMDRNKIAVGMASIRAGASFERADLARDLARRCNEYPARLRGEHPARFGALAALPTPDVDGALRAATYALDARNLDGVVMVSNVAGHYVGEAQTVCIVRVRLATRWRRPGMRRDLQVTEPVCYFGRQGWGMAQAPQLERAGRHLRCEACAYVDSND